MGESTNAEHDATSGLRGGVAPETACRARRVPPAAAYSPSFASIRARVAESTSPVSTRRSLRNTS